MKTLKSNWLPVAIIVVIAAIFAALGMSGWKTFLINGGSMEPTIPKYSLVVTQPVKDVQQLDTADIVTYEEDGKAVTHTFLQLESDGSLMTKGDANPTPDVHSQPLTQDRLIGKVVAVYGPLQLIGLLLIIISTFVAYSWMRDGEEVDELQAPKDNVIGNPDKPRQFELSADN